MAESLGEAVLDLTADSSKLREGLSDGRKAAQQAFGGMDAAAAKTAGGFTRVGASVVALNQGIQLLKAVASPFANLASGVIETNALLSRSKLQFESLLGSSAAAEKQVAQLFRFAAETPFETGPIIEASRHLATFGAEGKSATDNLRRVGDAAAGTSQPMESVAFWFGRAVSSIQAGKPFGEAAARLQEMGIVSATGRGRMEELAASGADASEIYETLTGEFERFEGQMEKQAGTWEGLTSTITDNTSLAIAEGFSPLFEAAKAMLDVLATFAQSEQFTAWIKRAVPAVASFTLAIFDSAAAALAMAKVLAQLVDGGINRLLAAYIAVTDENTTYSQALAELQSSQSGVATTIDTMIDGLANLRPKVEAATEDAIEQSQKTDDVTTAADEATTALEKKAAADAKAAKSARDNATANDKQAESLDRVARKGRAAGDSGGGSGGGSGRRAGAGEGGDDFADGRFKNSRGTEGTLHVENGGVAFTGASDGKALEAIGASEGFAATFQRTAGVLERELEDAIKTGSRRGIQDIIRTVEDIRARNGALFNPRADTFFFGRGKQGIANNALGEVLGRARLAVNGSEVGAAPTATGRAGGLAGDPTTAAVGRVEAAVDRLAGALTSDRYAYVLGRTQASVAASTAGRAGLGI